MTSIGIKYIQQRNSVLIRDSRTGKSEEIPVASCNKQIKKYLGLDSFSLGIASHIFLQINTA